MRNFFAVFVTLIFLLPLSSFAELNSRDQSYADLLLSGDIANVKLAGQAITNNDVIDTELLDLAAEVLVKKSAHAYPAEIDSLAWLAKGIGSSENGRYFTVLTQINESATDKRLIKHTKKALKALGKKQGDQYVAGMTTLPEDLYAPEDKAEQVERLRKLLLAGDLRNMKTAVREIYDTKVQDLELTDIIAEILLRKYAGANDGEIETLSWASKALGQSNSGRYVYVLTEVSEKGAHKKLRKHAKKSLKAHGQPKGEQYKLGMLKMELKGYDY